MYGIKLYIPFVGNVLIAQQFASERVLGLCSCRPEHVRFQRVLEMQPYQKSVTRNLAIGRLHDGIMGAEDAHHYCLARKRKVVVSFHLQLFDKISRYRKVYSLKFENMCKVMR